MGGSSNVIVSRLPKISRGYAENNTCWRYIERKLKEVIAQDENKVLQIDGSTGEQVTYAEFLRLVKRTAHAFRQEYGVRQGSAVLVSSRNSLYFHVPVYACLALGAVTYSIPAYSSDNIPTYMRDEDDVPLIICDSDILPNVRDYVNDAAESTSRKKSPWRPPTIILLEGEVTGYENIRSIFSRCDDSDDDNHGFPDQDPEDVCMIFLSSGSTGPPKSICHTHTNILGLTYNVDEFFTKEGDNGRSNRVRLFQVNQAHVGGFAIFLLILNMEETGIIFSNFTPDQLLPAIEKYKATDLGMYPKDAIYVSKAENWRDFDLSRVVSIGAGAAMFPPSIIDRLRLIFPNLTRPIYQFYASTEMLFVASSVSTGVGEIESGIGNLTPYVKGKVVSLETGKNLGPGEKGEFWFHTPFLMKCYRNRPDLTAAAVTPDGWYRTGDYGYYDEHERFHIVERVKDLIRLPSGRLVSPSRIEDIILRRADVHQVGVAGVPAEDGVGDVPRAFIVPKDGVDISTDDIIDFVRGETDDQDLHLTGGAEIVRGLVMSPGGKIYRMKLREDYLANLHQAVNWVD